MADGGASASFTLASAMATAAATAAASAAATSGADVAPACESGNDYNGLFGVRVSAIFVILIGSLIGTTFPVWAQRNQRVKIPEWPFFIAKYFGSGVIVATAFIHLLAPATDALTDPCLTGPITEYDWAEGIALMTVFVLFFVELLAMRFAVFDHPHDAHDQAINHTPALPTVGDANSETDEPKEHSGSPTRSGHLSSEARGVDHLGHSRTHVDPEAAGASPNSLSSIDNYSAQMTAIFILEFGVIFHSIFVGLTLAVAGEEFSTLYVVLVFHQTFEGLGIGTRFAAAPWPKGRKWPPYLLGIGYSLSTPIAIAVGLGIRSTYAPGSQTSLIVNGVFDSISAGILIYTGLVELMAHEFMFSESMRQASVGKMLGAFGVMCLGAGLMALLGKWA